MVAQGPDCPLVTHHTEKAVSVSVPDGPGAAIKGQKAVTLRMRLRELRQSPTGPIDCKLAWIARE